jgi:hypothetical protein
MRVSAWALALVLCFAARPSRASPRDSLDVTLLVAAEASLLIDMSQTIEAQDRGWFETANPLLGHNPSRGLIVGYFTGTMVATAALWYFVPQTRELLPLAVLAIEVPTIGANAKYGLSLALRF